MKKLRVLILFMMYLTSLSQAQKLSAYLIDENDFFNGTDRYYTNGAGLGVFFTNPKSDLFGEFLPTFKSSSWTASHYGVQVIQKMYTPSSISHSDPQVNDVPYAGTFTVTLSKVDVNRDKNMRFTSAFTAGVLGHQSYAGETQTWFHRLIGDQLPQGWDNQLRSEAIVEYAFDFEKVVFESRYVGLLATGGITAGTLLNQIETGASIRVGLLNPLLNSWFDHPSAFSVQLLAGGAYNRVFFNRLVLASPTEKTFETNVFSYAYGFEITTPSVQFTYTTFTQTKLNLHAQGHRYSSLAMHFCLI